MANFEINEKNKYQKVKEEGKNVGKVKSNNAYREQHVEFRQSETMKRIWSLLALESDKTCHYCLFNIDRHCSETVLR